MRRFSFIFKGERRISTTALTIIIILLLAVALDIFLYGRLKTWWVATAQEYMEKGDVHLANAELELALKDYQYALALKIDKDAASIAHLKTGRAWFLAGNLEKAILELEQSLKANSHQAEAYFYLAEIYFAQEKFSQALKNYSLANDLDPYHQGALLGLGKTLLSQGEVRVNYFLKVLEINPLNREANYYAGLFNLLDNPVKARNYLTRAQSEESQKVLTGLEKLPPHFSSRNYQKIRLAQIFIEVRQLDLAEIYLQSVIRNDSSYRDAWALLGQSYFLREEYKKARDSFRTALRLDPDNKLIKSWTEETETILQLP